MSLRMRRGGIADAPPPPTQTYGPIFGRQDVIDNAKPRVVTDPGGGITFTTAADLQTKVNANPAGSTFVHAAGGTEVWTTQVNVGTLAPKIYFLGLAGSTATTLDGGGADNYGIAGSQSGAYEIHGGTWTNFGSLAGGATKGSAFILRDGCLAEDFVSHTNWVAGFKNLGSNVIVRFAESHHNGENAWETSEATPGGPLRDNNLYTRIHCHHNNTRQLHPGGHAGGVKMLQVSNNNGSFIYSHDEYGFALWYDTARLDPGLGGNGFENCVVENSIWCGIFLEGVAGGSFARHNYIKDCGVGNTGDPNTPTSFQVSWQIGVSTSNGLLGLGTPIDISFNIVDSAGSHGTNPLGIGIFNHDGHPNNCRNIQVMNNQVFARNTGVCVGGNDDSAAPVDLWPDVTNLFDFQDYHVQDTSLAHWKWAGTGSGQTRTYVEWRAFNNHDTNASLAAI